MTPTISGTRWATSIPESVNPRTLSGVVGHHACALDPEVGQDCRCRTVFASVDGFVEFEIRLDRVEALILQSVGGQFLEQPDPATLVSTQVDDDTTVVTDAFDRRVELGGSAFAAL